MSRERQRQVKRLRNLAEFIQKNPKEFDMQDSTKCILGLASRLRKGKVQAQPSVTVSGNSDLTSDFEKRFGVPRDIGKRVFVGQFDKVNRNFRSYNTEGGFPIGTQRVPVRTAVAMLNHLAKRVESGKFA
jgi:hypothetical protein